MAMPERTHTSTQQLAAHAPKSKRSRNSISILYPKALGPHYKELPTAQGGKKSRYVPCNSVLRAELRKLIEARGTQAEMPILHTRNGTPVSQDNFDNRFRKDIEEAGVKQIRFHDLRHTGTTLMIAEGLDIKTVQEICGHQEVSTTMKYVHLLGDSVRKAGARFVIGPKEAPTMLKLVQS